eukprot:4307844-Pyramimonas_sp.AAC.1
MPARALMPSVRNFVAAAGGSGGRGRRFPDPLRVAGGGGGTVNADGAAGGAGQRCRGRPPGGEGIAGRARMMTP